MGFRLTGDCNRRILMGNMRMSPCVSNRTLVKQWQTGRNGWDVGKAYPLDLSSEAYEELHGHDWGLRGPPPSAHVGRRSAGCASLPDWHRQ